MRLRVAALAVSAALATASPALAVRGVVWTEPAAGLLRGDADSVSFTGRGAIVLAPRAEDLSAAAGGGKDPLEETVAEPIVWCEALDRDGNLILGTGHSGRVLRVTPQGDVSTLAALSEPEVTAVHISADGTIYAGTSPNGAIYRLSGTGESTVAFDPEERYIWSIAEDEGGTLFIGTGEKGKLFRLPRTGGGSLAYDSPEPHITTIVFDRRGGLIAGTAGTGIVYRIDPGKGATVLYDSNLPEIVDLTVDGAGQVYAAAVAAGVGELPPPSVTLRVRPSEDEGPVPPAPEELAPVKPREPARDRQRQPMEAEFEGLPLGEAAAAKVREGGGVVFRISPDGGVDEVWRSSQEVPYTVSAASDGQVFVGTGEPAKLLRLEEGGKASLLARFPQAQITSLALDRTGRIFVATSNSGGAYRVSRDLAESGTYQSPPRDAGVRARWGKVRWDAAVGSGQRVEIQTRTGNSELPDETWSAWSSIYGDPEGSDIVSAPARYIQWRAHLVRSSAGSSSPMLRSVAVTYLPRNRVPRIREVKLLSELEAASGGGEPSAGPGTPATPQAKAPSVATESTARPGAPGTQRMRTIVWHAEDPDDDQLVFRVQLQKEGEDRWTPLAADLTDSTLTFDQMPWPEGRYKVRAIASDAPSNVPGEELTAESHSDTSLIDHTPPRLEMIASRRPDDPVRVRASDELSQIVAAEIVAGERTLSAAKPVDGVLDFREEVLEIELPGEIPPEGVRLRVRDGAGNESSLVLAGAPTKSQIGPRSGEEASAEPMPRPLGTGGTAR